jgi:hypothetical protein
MISVLENGRVQNFSSLAIFPAELKSATHGQTEISTLYNVGQALHRRFAAATACHLLSGSLAFERFVFLS